MRSTLHRNTRCSVDEIDGREIDHVTERFGAERQNRYLRYRGFPAKRSRDRSERDRRVIRVNDPDTKSRECHRNTNQTCCFETLSRTSDFDVSGNGQMLRAQSFSYPRETVLWTVTHTHSLMGRSMRCTRFSFRSKRWSMIFDDFFFLGKLHLFFCSYYGQGENGVFFPGRLKAFK